jgi:hypothetical protein
LFFICAKFIGFKDTILNMFWFKKPLLKCLERSVDGSLHVFH